MAALIKWLASAGAKNGAGAANAGGTIYFYLPGTTTDAAVYQDAAKSAQHSQPVILDGNGCATVYTDRRVRMDIYDYHGALVARLDPGNSDTSAQVEVENSKWTGLLSTGSQGAGGLTLLDTVLTRIGNSAGGTDGKFLYTDGGTERLYVDVVKELRVSAKDFGAKGDDGADDTAAIRSAIAVLKAAGGGTLYLPKGTYRINDELIIDFNNLTVRGDGAGSIIRTTVTNKNIFTVTSDQLRFQGFGMDVISGSASSNAALSLSGAESVVIDQVSIINFKYGIDISGAALAINCTASITDPVTTAGACVRVAGSARRVNLRGCYFENPAGSGVGITVGGSASHVMVDACYFGDGFAKCFEVINGATGTHFTLVGNRFDSSASAITVTSTAVAAHLRHYGNSFGTATVADNGQTVASAAAVSLNGRAYCVVTGTTNIDHIGTAGYVAGDIVTLKFSGALTVNDNTGGAAAGFAPVQLTGAFTSTADDVLRLLYDGTDWKEVSRAVL